MNDIIYRSRLEQHEAELKSLYMELYRNEAMYDSLIAGLAQYSEQRSPPAEEPGCKKGGTDWYKSEELLGMMLYIDNFAGNLQGVREKIEYLYRAYHDKMLRLARWRLKLLGWKSYVHDAEDVGNLCLGDVAGVEGVECNVLLLPLSQDVGHLVGEVEEGPGGVACRVVGKH